MIENSTNQSILDNFDTKRNSLKRYKLCLIVTAFVSLFVLILIEYFENWITLSIDIGNGASLSTIGLIVMAGIAIVSFVNTYNLYHLIKSKNRIKIILFSGTLIFVIEFLYKILQKLIYFPLESTFDFISAIKISLAMGFSGILVSNIALAKIRNKSMRNPILLLIGSWILFGYLLK